MKQRKDASTAAFYHVVHYCIGLDASCCTNTGTIKADSCKAAWLLNMALDCVPPAVLLGRYYCTYNNGMKQVVSYDMLCKMHSRLTTAYLR